MSVDVTSITIQAKSDGVDAAARSLNNLADAAARAEAANVNLGNTTTRTGTAQANATTAVDRLLERYQRQTDLLGANVSQQNAYNVSMQGGTAAQVALAQQLGATVDAYRRLAADQAEAIRMNREFSNSSNTLFSSLTEINQGLELLGKAWSVIKKVAGEFLDMADAITLMDSRLRIITKSAQEYNAAQADIYRIAQANNASLQNTAALYTKLYDPITRLGGTTKEVGRITEAFAATLRISGATAGQTSAAVLQFGEALGSGRLNGDELKSLSENAPRFMQVLADSLKVPTGALKEMGSEGKLTADIIGNALLQSFDKLQKQAVEVGNTVGGAMSDLKNDVLVAAGAFDKLTGTSGTVANSIQAVSFLVQAFANILKATAEESKTATDGLDAMGIIIKGLGTVLEVPILLFSDVVYVFKGIGREIGGIAAQIVAVINRDFKAVGTIRDQMLEDNKKAEQDLKIFQDRIANLSKVAESLRGGNGNGDSSGSATLKAAADEKSLTEARMRLAGITKNYFDDLNSLQKSLESGLITQQEYIKLVSDLATKTYAASTAGKELSKSQKDAEKIQRQYQASFVDLINTINAKDAVTKSALTSEDKLTEAEKFAAKVQSDLADGAIKLVAVRGMSIAQQKKIIDATLQQYVVDSQAFELQKQINKELKTNQKESESRVDSIQKKTAEVTAQVKAYNDLPDAIRKAGVTEKQMADNVSQAKIDAIDEQIAKEGNLDSLGTMYNERRVEQLKAEKKALEELRDIQVQREAQQTENKFNLGFAQRSKEEASMAVQAFKDAGKEISEGLQDIFGDAGKPISSFFTAITDGLAKQTAAQEKYNKVKEMYKDAPEAVKMAKLKEADIKLTKEQTSAQLGMYADVASSAQGFFDKQSTGYKVLGAVSSAFHAAEVAMAIASIAPKIAAGAASMFATLGPFGFAAVAGMVAVMAGFGFSGGGSGSAPPTSATRQAANGTGSVLGDSDAKSESIQKALDTIAKDSGLGLVHFSSMDKSLQTLVQGISGLSSLLVSGTKLTAPVAATTFGNSAASSAVTSIAKIADVTFGMVDKLTGGLSTKITAAIFGGKTSVQDVGLNIGSGSLGSVLQNGANVNQYTDIKTSGGLFSSDKYKTQTQSLGAEVNNQFTMVIASLANTIKSAAGTLGIGGKEFEDHLSQFVIDIGEISTKGLTGDKIQEALETAFSKLGDDMAKFAIVGLDKFQKVGEGYLETVARVANDLIQVQDVFAVLGKTLNLTGLAAVEASEGLISMFGSVDKLAEATKYFVDNFLTDAEKLVPIQKSLNAELTRLHLSTDLSVDDFKKLVMSQDLTTSAGQEMYAALMNIAPAMLSVRDASKAATEALIEASKKTANSAFDSLSEAISKAKDKAQAAYDAQAAILNAQISSLTEARQSITALVSSLDSAFKTVTGFADSTFAMSRAQAQANLDAALTTARTTGKLPTEDSLKDTLASLTKDPANSFSSYSDYIKDIGITAGKISNLKDLASEQGTVVDKQLATAKSQLEVAKKTLDLENKKFDDMLAFAQQQLDAMNGTTTAIMSLTSAFTAFNASVLAAISNQAGTIGSNGKPITSTKATAEDISGLYSSVLGREGQQFEVDYWLSKGLSASQLVNYFLGSDEYLASHPNGSHANGLDSVPFDGYTAKLHKGEMVLPAKQAKGVAQGGDMVAVVEAIEKSCSETVAVQAAMQEDIRKLYKRIVDMSPAGDRLQTDEVGAP